MTLIRTSLLNAIAVGVRMLTLLGINKVLAIYVGPAGYAAVGQFQNAVQMITVFASGAINTGVTKYTAEYSADELKLKQLWRTAGSITLLGSIVCAAGISVFHNRLAAYFLGSVEYGGVFLWFAASILLFTFNALLLAILNGKKDVARYVIANIAGSLFSLLITALMAMSYGLYGALVALAVYQSVAFFVTLAICCKTSWFSVRSLFGRLDPATVRNLGKFALMALTSAICVPLGQIVIRNHLGAKFGWEAAGYWEAMWRLSTAYLMLITTTLGVYFLPRLSELKDPADIKQEIKQGYKIILPGAAVAGIVIYLMRDFIIAVLFTPDFSPMRELFAWQMVGDALKVGSWVLAFLMLGKAMFKMFIVAELIYTFGFIGLTYLFTNYWGFVGVAIAHAVNYLIYWVVVWRATSTLLKKNDVPNVSESCD
jgi:PST family polysaccharide transporter